jgi:thymidylate synthase
MLRGIKYEYGDLSDVVALLSSDPYTRQAYLPIWFPEDTGGGSKRAPCTLGYHFIMRENKLDITYYIRSCDMLRHFRDDIYLTHRLALWVITQCMARNPKWKEVEPGTFNMHITSLHIFANDWQSMFPQYTRPA